MRDASAVSAVLFPRVLGRGSGSKPLAEPGTCLPFWLHSSPAARSPCSWWPVLSSLSCHPPSCSLTLQEQRSGNPTRTWGFSVPWLRGGFGAWLCCRGEGKGWGKRWWRGWLAAPCPPCQGKLRAQEYPLPGQGPQEGAGAGGGEALQQAKAQGIPVLGLQQRGDPSSLPLAAVAAAAMGSMAEQGARQG